MNTIIPTELIQEATELLEKWARERGILTEGRQLAATLSLRILPPVILDVQVHSTLSVDERDELFSQPVQILKCNNRARHCLDTASVYIIGDLVRKTEQDLLRWRNLGKKTCQQIKDRLLGIGLTLDMYDPVGPREREIVLTHPVSCLYMPHEDSMVSSLYAAKITTIKDLLSVSQGEILQTIREHYRTRSSHLDAEFYTTWALSEIQERLKRRGLLSDKTT